MSERNVEIVRRIYQEQMIDRDQERFRELFTPDVEYVNPPEAIEPGIRHGPEAVERAIRSSADFFDLSWNELLELFDCGDCVVAAVTFHTRGRGSQSEVLQQEAHTWTLREGRIARYEWGRDLGAALEAARLSGAGEN
jgi:ketosteroid isomerase-like protein